MQSCGLLWGHIQRVRCIHQVVHTRSGQRLDQLVDLYLLDPQRLAGMYCLKFQLLLGHHRLVAQLQVQ